jgi:branched-chain amino acid transport system permease protein
MTRWWPVPALLLCILLPWLPGLPLFWVTLANMIGISAIVATGLVVLTGIGGMTSFAQASFMGFGAYATAILSTREGISPWLGLPAAMAASGLAAFAIGAVTLRLKAHYLALGTIAWSVSLFYLFGNLDFVGRNDGISAIPPLSIMGLRLIDVRLSATLIGITLVAVTVATSNLLDSRWGRAIRSLRGGAMAASSCGVDIARARMLAFVYAALLAGLAGWLFAHLQRAVNPTPFGLNAGIQYLLMAVVGGAAYLPGAILGSALVVIVNDRLQDWLPKLLGTSGNFEIIAFGLLLVLVLQVAPNGLWPLLARARAKHRAIVAADPLPKRAQQAASTAFEVTALSKNFGGLAAVSGLSFSLAPGELLALIGPNGAGKSTSFNLLTGVLRPDSGTVRLMGTDVTGLAAPAMARRGVARSFQHVKLVAHMSVIENVALGVHLRGHASPWASILRLDRAEEARLFAEAARQLAHVGLLDLADRPATSLALGQQRIVEIARALCQDPSVLLLDEPAAGLRHAEKQALATLLRRLAAEGMAILLVEHDMDFVMNLAHRIVVMDFGTRIAEGAPEAVRQDPAVIEAYLGGAA